MYYLCVACACIYLYELYKYVCRPMHVYGHVCIHACMASSHKYTDMKTDTRAAYGPEDIERRGGMVAEERLRGRVRRGAANGTGIAKGIGTRG